VPGESAKLLQAFTAWVVKKRGKYASPIEFFGAYNEFLNSVGLGIFRANFASRSLHPQFGAISLIWSSMDDIPLPPVAAGALDVQKMKIGK
jgi:hypothetical protein